MGYMRAQPLPELIRSLMRERGVTYEELARRAGIAHDTAKSLTRRVKQPEIETLANVALALGLEPGDIPQYRLAVLRHNLDELPPDRGGVGLDQALTTLDIIEGALAGAALELPEPAPAAGNGRRRAASGDASSTPRRA